MEDTEYQSSLDNLISSIFITEFKLVVKKRLIKKKFQVRWLHW